MRRFFSFFLLFMGTVFPFEGDGDFDIMGKCITNDPVKLKYDPTQTKITFYGDSRMDFVNSPGYGKSTMPSILNEPYANAGPYSADLLFTEENIQNLGKEGYRSYEIVRHLDNCIPKMSKNYKVAKRFVFHVGGNNFMDSVIASAHALQYLHYCRPLLELPLSSSSFGKTSQLPISKCIPEAGEDRNVLRL